MTSPSGIGREMECMTSAILPVSKFVHPRGIRGTDLHRFMKDRILAADDDQRAEALEAVPEEWRGAASSVDWSRIPFDSETATPEYALIWNIAKDEVREVGRNGEIDHDELQAMIGAGEYGGVIDLLSLTEDAVVLCDWKFSYGASIDKAEINGQMRSYAVLAAKLFKKSRAEMLVCRIPDNGQPWWSTESLDSLGLDSAEAAIRKHLRDVEAARETYRSSGIVPTPVEGTWCSFCPAANSCPARVALLLSALAEDEAKAAALARLPEPLTPEAAARLWPKLVQAERLIERLKGNVKDIARTWGGLKLDNGNVVGEVETSRETIDPVFARPALEARFGKEWTDFTIRTEEKITKERLDELCRNHSSHGGMAKLKRTVMAELDAAGAIKTTITRGIQEVAGTSKRLKASNE